MDAIWLLLATAALVLLLRLRRRPRSTLPAAPPDGFDYIIVGGGAAGAVLAARLSEDPSKSVLLLEAGTASPRHPFVRIPVGLLRLFANRAFDWCFRTKVEPKLGREVFLCRGKMLGGSTCLNAQLALRGSRSDYDEWKLPGWTAADLEATFEAVTRRDSETMAECGMHVQLPGYQHDLSRRFLASCVTAAAEPPGTEATRRMCAQLRPVSDFNEEAWSEARRTGGKCRGEGSGRFELAQRRGERWTSAASYLAAAAGRPNLHQCTGVLVARVQLGAATPSSTPSSSSSSRHAQPHRRSRSPAAPRTGHKPATRPSPQPSTKPAALRAEGVVVVVDSAAGGSGEGGETLVPLAAGGEVLLCAGALGSPHVLQLSGVGDAAALRGAGIEPRHQLPGVGERLQDHAAVVVACRTRERRDITHDIRPLLPLSRAVSPLALARWLLRGTGPLATSGCDHGAFVRTAAALAQPDLQVRFVPGLGPHPDGVKAYELLGRGVVPSSGGFTVQLITARPASAAGRVAAASADPRQPPQISCGYLDADEDRATLRRGVALARALCATRPLADVVAAEAYPGAHVVGDAAVDRYIDETLHSANGLAGTCKMGADDDERAVVDTTLRVRGIGGLRVCDASVLPKIVGGQLALPTLVVAERAAAMIREGC